MSTTQTDKRLIRLAAPDNVLLLATSIPAGEALTIEDQVVELAVTLTLGHKIAATPISAGDVILKYNFPIGVATKDIAVGEHVHVHNVESGYTPSYVVPDTTVEQA